MALLEMENWSFSHASSGPDGKPGFGGSCFPKDIRYDVF